MKVLGISPLDKESTVTLVEDGVVIYAAAEERFTRVKQQDGFPWRALGDALSATGTTPEDIDRVVYPFLTWEEETRLFERHLANERDFLDEAEVAGTGAALREAQKRVPLDRAPVPGLSEPNERLDKGFLKTLAYRVLASEGVVSRNVAKRGSDRWGREASMFHRRHQEDLEAALRDVGLADKLKRVEHHSCACGQRVLLQRLRRGADRHDRRLRFGPGRKRQHRSLRHDRAHPRP